VEHKPHDVLAAATLPLKGNVLLNGPNLINELLTAGTTDVDLRGTVIPADIQASRHQASRSPIGLGRFRHAFVECIPVLSGLWLRQSLALARPGVVFVMMRQTHEGEIVLIAM
jgi:hypothetical protein